MASSRRRLAERRKARGYSQEQFAEALRVDRTTVQRWEKGENDPQPWHRPKIARLLGLDATELEAVLGSGGTEHRTDGDDELEAWELLRRVRASDVGPETLSRLEADFDELAIAYATTPPQDLLPRVRRHTAYVAQLLDCRKPLKEHRRLLTVGGWLSLIGATLHIDLKQRHAAAARLQTAAALAHEADQPEIEAWCFETEAWRVLTAGDYQRALELSRTAQKAAPKGSSAAIQSTAQEGRARARLGQARETYAAIDRVHTMAASADTPERPEHHYRYDPSKSLAYTATTLAWLGDASAETHAREVIDRLNPSDDITKWPRRVATANIDLGLALLAQDRLDEACDAAQRAILSGRIVPSSHWRAREVVAGLEKRNLPEVKELREVYEGMKRLTDR
ncbi:helix-turn-helix domain-containing protein [Streptomyces sp. NPDC048172]|uniref:helix-turn-helix domain-containing protein n=1 Tax=Streptomyces sp. NPDC048172 TaxID=3365505 RepID=UPI0037198942